MNLWRILTVAISVYFTLRTVGLIDRRARDSVIDWRYSVSDLLGLTFLVQLPFVALFSMIDNDWLSAGSASVIALLLLTIALRSIQAFRLSQIRSPFLRSMFATIVIPCIFIFCWTITLSHLTGDIDSLGIPELATLLLVTFIHMPVYWALKRAFRSIAPQPIGSGREISRIRE